MKTTQKLTVVSAFVFLLSCASPVIKQTVTTPNSELSDLFSKYIPEMKNYQLVDLDEPSIINTLKKTVVAKNRQPVKISLPIFNVDRKLSSKDWVLYFNNVRSETAFFGIWDGKQSKAEQSQLLEPISLTFQGIPDLSFDEIQTLEKEVSGAKSLDESKYQASAVSIIGNHIQATYYGNEEIQQATYIQSLEDIFSPYIGVDAASKLNSNYKNKYVFYNSIDYKFPVQHKEVYDKNYANQSLSSNSVDTWISPQRHAGEQGIKELHPVMIADSTIYDPTTQRWLQNNWYAKVDAAVNQQNLFLRYYNLGTDVRNINSVNPALGLTQNNNRIIVKSKIVGYLVLTDYGKQILSTSTGICNENNSFLDKVTTLGTENPQSSNEYWMWWTQNYGGSGCAWISTLGKTPRQRATGVTSLAGTSAGVTYVFSHESGHIIGGLHSDTETTSERGRETWASHRCKFLGGAEVGQAAPSLMSYADSANPTLCFAQTDPARSNTKKNVSYVAEFLHRVLAPTVAVAGNPTISSLKISVSVSDDALDGGSSILGAIRLNSGFLIEANLNNGQQIGNNETRDFIYTLPAGTRYSDLRQFKLRFVSRGWTFCCVDTPHFNRVKVQYISGGTTGTLFDDLGLYYPSNLQEKLWFLQ